jgi:DNA repair photolyase
VKLEFREYEVRKIVNIHKHVDAPWFWDKYSAHPYVGCRSGCEFCYSRGGYYLGKRDPTTFDSLIQIKTNAVALLRKELPRLQKDIIACGDWQQPAEDRYRLSRQMLEVVCEFSFPLFVIERSTLIVRDLDLLTEINQRAWVGVAFSLSNLDPALKHAFEPRSPGVKRRLQAMQKLATAGILTGASVMPVIPFAGDNRAQLDQVIQAVHDHGGKFVLAGGLSMDGIQAERTLLAARRFDRALPDQMRQLYRWRSGGKPNYSPPQAYSSKLGLLVRELCTAHNISDRIPRYIAPGQLAINKKIAERLFLKTYDLELVQADSYRLWAYRKAAWMVDAMPESIADVYRAQGEAGLLALPDIGESLVKQIVAWLEMEMM